MTKYKSDYWFSNMIRGIYIYYRTNKSYNKQKLYKLLSANYKTPDKKDAYAKLSEAATEAEFVEFLKHMTVQDDYISVCYLIRYYDTDIDKNCMPVFGNGWNIIISTYMNAYILWSIKMSVINDPRMKKFDYNIVESAVAELLKNTSIDAIAANLKKDIAISIAVEKSAQDWLFAKIKEFDIAYNNYGNCMEKKENMAGDPMYDVKVTSLKRKFKVAGLDVITACENLHSLDKNLKKSSEPISTRLFIDTCSDIFRNVTKSDPLNNMDLMESLFCLSIASQMNKLGPGLASTLMRQLYTIGSEDLDFVEPMGWLRLKCYDIFKTIVSKLDG